MNKEINKLADTEFPYLFAVLPEFGDITTRLFGPFTSYAIWSALCDHALKRYSMLKAGNIAAACGKLFSTIRV